MEHDNHDGFLQTVVVSFKDSFFKCLFSGFHIRIAGVQCI